MPSDVEMKFIIFHGAFGSPEGNWFPELKEKLELLGQEVIVPRFSVEDWQEVSKVGKGFRPKHQSIENWLRAFKEARKRIKLNEKLCFIGHSLGCLFILHAVEKYGIKLDCAIFVSPFLKPLGKWQFDIVNDTFYREDFDFGKLQKLIPLSYVLYSNDDPYVSTRHFVEFAGKMRSATIPIRRAGHLNSEVNFNKFPLVYELCKSRLDLSLYQKYLAHRSELYAIPYVKGKSEEIVYLNPGEVINEGVFHFRNLRKEGFCTLYTAASFWDPESVYMQEARKAAARVQLTRVLIVKKPAELRNSEARKQVALDLAAGIRVYLCHFDDIRRSVAEPDFGIWDGEYVCTVSFDMDGKASSIRMSSRKADLIRAGKWKEEILRIAVEIRNAGDVAGFPITK